MPRFMNLRFPAVHMDDLEAIITDKSAKLANRRTYHIVIASFAFLCVSCVCLLIGVITLTSRNCTGSDDESTHSGSVCMTAGCLQAAAGILDSADFNVNPCDDFHQYACGGWIKRHSVPPDQAYISVFDHLFAASEEKLREALESPVQRAKENSSERKMKEFFSLCIHDYGRMKDSGRTMVEEIENSLGGWYVLDTNGWQTKWDFKRALVKAHTDYAVPVLFNYYVSPDPKDRSKNIIGIQLPPVDFDINSFQDGESRIFAFRYYVRKLGELLIRDAGRNVTQSEWESLLDVFEEDIFRQEMEIAQLRLLVDDTSQWEGKVFTLQDLTVNFTQVDWLSIITNIFHDAGVTGESHVAITSLPYFYGLEKKLMNKSLEMQRRMNNYLVWMVVHTFADHLSWEFRQLKYDFLEKITGRTEFPSTWHACLSLMKAKMGFALAVELAKIHMADKGREEVGEMVELLKIATLKSISRATWMDTETRSLAVLKIKNMETEIGFPPVLSNEDEVDKVYSNLLVNKNESFFRNLLHASRFKGVLASIEYTTGYKYNLWEYAFFYNPLGVRPLYLWFYNTLIVPPGVFSLPLYSRRAPQALNYGALGSYLSARMIRSVDEVGRLVINGTFQTWWTDATFSAFQQERKCYIPARPELMELASMPKSSAKTVKIDGQYQIIRVVAETAGLRLAYSAYKDWVNKHQKEPLLPGLNMTSEQIFFLASAQARCTLRRDESAHQLAASGALPVDKMLNSMMSHFKGFSRAFHCPAGSPMSPVQKCHVFSPED